MLSRFYGACLCDCHCHRSKCKESRLLILNYFLLKFLTLAVSWIDIRYDTKKVFLLKFIEWPNIDQRLKRCVKSFIFSKLLVIENFQVNLLHEGFLSEKLISVVSELSCLCAISIFS